MACSDVLTLLDVVDNKLMTAVGKGSTKLSAIEIADVLASLVSKSNERPFRLCHHGLWCRLPGTPIAIETGMSVVKVLGIYFKEPLCYIYLEILFLKNIFISFYFVKNDSDYLYLP